MKNEFNFGSNVIHQQFGKGVVRRQLDWPVGDN